MVTKLWEKKELVCKGLNLGGKDQNMEEISTKIDIFLQIRESNICACSDWNFNYSLGFDILELIFGLTNDSFNFSYVQTIVDQVALQEMLLFRSSDGAFKLFGSRQSTIFMSCLDFTFRQLPEDQRESWIQYLEDLETLLDQEGISSSLDTL